MIWYEICLVDETNNLLVTATFACEEADRSVMVPHASPHGSRTSLAWLCSPWAPRVTRHVCPGAGGGTARPLAGHWAHPAQDWATTCGYRCARGSLCTLGNGLSVPLTTQSPLKSMPFKHPNSFRYLAVDPDSVLGQATRQFWGLWRCK